MTPEELSALQDAGWVLSEDKIAIKKLFKFKNFKQAMAWMMQMSFEAEALDHHPEWENVYNRITVRLTTHSTGGLTELDAKLARKMDVSIADQS